MVDARARVGGRGADDVFEIEGFERRFARGGGWSELGGGENVEQVGGEGDVDLGLGAEGLEGREDVEVQGEVAGRGEEAGKSVRCRVCVGIRGYKGRGSCVLSRI